SGLITGLAEKFFDDATTGDAARLGTNSASLAASDDGLVPSPVARSEWPSPHESAHQHVTGAAMYTDDQTVGKQMLEVWPVCSPHAHARIVRRDANAARQMPGISAVLLAEDIPGENTVGAVRPDEVLLAGQEAMFHGNLVALVVGESQEACRAAADRVM